MHRRHPLPRLWLMTDERQGEGLWEALAKLPRGAGVVLRHYSLPEQKRKALFKRIRKTRRDLIVLVAGPPRLARKWGAAGSHGRHQAARTGVTSAPVHDLSEIRAAERAGADILFLSPVHGTRSHPGAQPLGPARFALLAGKTRLPVIALGGMTPRRARKLTRGHGWAAIDAWSA